MTQASTVDGIRLFKTWIIYMLLNISIWHKGIFIMATNLEFIKSDTWNFCYFLDVTDCFSARL